MMLHVFFDMRLTLQLDEGAKLWCAVDPSAAPSESHQAWVHLGCGMLWHPRGLGCSTYRPVVLKRIISLHRLSDIDQSKLRDHALGHSVAMDISAQGSPQTLKL